MRLRQQIQLLRKVAGDPLESAMRLAEIQPDADTTANVVKAIADEFPAMGTARAMRVAARVCGALVEMDAGRARSLIAELRIVRTHASAWLTASLLGALEEYSAAAEALQGMTDPDWAGCRAERLTALAENLLECGQPNEAGSSLIQAAGAAETLAALNRIDVLARRAGDCLPIRDRVRLAIVGSVTLDLLPPAIRSKCLSVGIAAEVYTGPFGQWAQEILDPNTGLYQFRPDVVIVASDWRSYNLDSESDVRSRIDEIERLWRLVRARTGAAVLQHSCEIPSIDPSGTRGANGVRRLLRRMNVELQETAAQYSGGVLIVDIDQLAGRVGKEQWDDPALWQAARQYPSASGIPALAREYAAILRALRGLSAKCLALDLDGTLWGGVVGEDGPSGIEIGGGASGQAFLEFQQYVRSLATRGVLLAACSKNNATDAQAPFRDRREMALTLDCFSAFYANWRPKTENLAAIAQDLNIGLDSIVFFDDNPAERALVRHGLPQVIVPEVPADPALYVRFLDNERLFDAVTGASAEDRGRTEWFRADSLRAGLSQSAQSLDDYLASLDMRVELEPVAESNIRRVTQLLNKTNQFNLTTRRLTEAQVRAAAEDTLWYSQALRVRDRFGDAGLVGVLMAVADGGKLHIDTWLLSCRVLGRRLEEVMLDGLLRFARANSIEAITGEYVPTAKNQQVADLYDRFGFTRETGEGRFLYRLQPVRAGFVPFSRLIVEDRIIGSMALTRAAS